MAELTDTERSTVKNTFAKMDSKAVGPAALSRFLTVYPWTQKYFKDFADLSNADAVRSNPNVTAHGKVVLDSLAGAAQNLDNIKATDKELNVLHSEKLKVDPGNFNLLTDIIIVEVAAEMGKDFTPEVHAPFQKFMDVAVSAQKKQDH